MLRILLWSGLLLFLALGAQAQGLSGVVVDASTGEPLPGATLEVLETGAGVATDADGRFAFPQLAQGVYRVRVRFVGYEPADRVLRAPDSDVRIGLYMQAVGADEVVVTGSALGSAIRYQSVQAYNLENLQRRSGTSIGEMLDGAPGLAMRSFGPAPARPVVRGFDGDRLLVLENGERSGDLGETAADHATSIDPLAANRIEVVRGPASLLYGAGAIGGVVNIISDDAPGSWGLGFAGDLALQGASVNRQGAAFSRVRYGTESMAFTGRLAVREAGDLRTPEGVLPGTSLRNLDAGAGAAVRSQGFNGALFVSALDRSYGLPELDSDAEIRIEMYRQSLQGQARWDHGGFFENTEVRLQAARYGHDEVETENGEEAIGLAFEQQMFSFSAITQHRAWGPFARGAVGVNAFARALEVGGDEALTPDARALTLATFAFQELRLSRILRAQVGVRAEHQTLGLRPNPQYPAADDRRNSTALSAAFGINLRPSRNVEAGVQVAQAYRTPTLEERFSNAAHIGAGAYEIGDPTLELEQALGTDAFVRVAAGPLRAEWALFYTRIRDFVVYQPTGQVHAPSGLPIFTYERDAASMLGGEFQASVDVAPQWQLGFSADYARGARTSTDTPLPRIPPMRGLFSLQHDAASHWLGTSVRLVAEQNRVAENEETTPGYALVSLEGGMRVGPFRKHVVSLRVDNLLDASYRDHLSRVESRGAPMPGRNVNLTYRWTW